MGVFPGCGDPNTGFQPPPDNIFFPQGLLLDPRTPPGRAARYLFVSNGNNDLSYNGSTVVAIDLDAFFSAWSESSVDGGVDELEYSYSPFPYCEGAGGRCVLDVGAPVSDRFPCRRLGLMPQVVECDEGPFVVDSVQMGDFSTLIAASNEPSGIPRLWVPVRGDPSIVFIDVEGDWPGPPDLACGQGRRDGEAVDDSRCADSFRLTHLRNDGDLELLPGEPFNIHVAETDEYRYAFVAHGSGPSLTVVALDGLHGGDGRPAIVDIEDIFVPTSSSVSRGGYGLATRPCGSCGDEGGSSVPSITRDCSRPLVYGTLRWQLLATSFTVSGIDPEGLPGDAYERRSCEDDQGNYLGPYCASPEQVGDACALVCEPQVRGAVRFSVGGLDPQSTSSAETLGALAFGDECGDSLYVLQTNPGALLRLDTSVEAGEPLDIPAGRSIEVCDQPTQFTLWRERGLAFVACYQSANVFVVDLRTDQVVDVVTVGTGPSDLVLDPVRELLYVANLLEGSVSVLDVSRHRVSRNREVARIGLQEPYTG